MNSHRIVATYIVSCFQGAQCRPWNLDATPTEAPVTITLSLVMLKRNHRWIIVDDETYGSLKAQPDPPWFQRK